MYLWDNLRVVTAHTERQRSIGIVPRHLRENSTERHYKRLIRKLLLLVSLITLIALSSFVAHASLAEDVDEAAIASDSDYTNMYRYIKLVQISEKDFYKIMALDEAWMRGLSDEMTDKMIRTIECESGFNPGAYNGSDSHKTSVGSHGIAQYASGTIKHYGKEAGLTNPDPYNVRHSLFTMAYMFDIGEAKQWTCYRKLT